MSVEITSVYDGDLHCTSVHGPSKQVLITDAPVDNGGRGEAFSPTDLVATAAGTCVVTVMDLVAKREGLNLVGTRIHVTKEMTAVPTRRIGKLTITLTYPKELVFTDEQRKKLEGAAHACPVKKSLHPDVEVDLHFIHPRDASAPSALANAGEIR